MVRLDSYLSLATNRYQMTPNCSNLFKRCTSVYKLAIWNKHCAQWCVGGAHNYYINGYCVKSVVHCDVLQATKPI